MSSRSFKYFIQPFWRTVETEPLVMGWHIDAIADHLQAVSDGEIRRLIINMPPRHSKSMNTSVLWPAWDWLYRQPERKFLFASYAASLSIRDSVKCRRVISSPKYMRWRDYYCIGQGEKKWTLTGDQNAKQRFDNTRGGYRLATSVDGALTGEGGDIIVIDDPHNVIEGESTAVRESTVQWWDEAMSTRLNNPKTGAYVIIMQRVHEDDVSGHILAREHGWDHLCLPARYEGKNRIISSIGFKDPRRVIDEPLWPERYDDVELKKLEDSLGKYAAAGQLQQHPSPREGGMFPRDKFRIIQNTEFDRSTITASIRYWDKAATAGAGCYSVGVLMHKLKNNQVVVEDAEYGQWDSLTRERRIKAAAQRDGRKVTVWVEQEPGSGGKESAEATVRNLSGYTTYMDKISGEGDKERRADPFAAQVQGGNVFLIEGAWNKEYLDEHEMFPNGKYKDCVDASSGAYNKHFARKKAGTW